MSPYIGALIVDEMASEPHLAEAARVLERCTGVVMLRNMVALRPRPHAIWCEVIDPTPDSHRCAEEFKVLVENAAYALAESKLAAHLPQRPLQWIVVDARGPAAVKLWPES